MSMYTCPYKRCLHSSPIHTSVFLQLPCSDLMRRARYVGYGTNVSLIATCTNSIFMLMAQFLPASIVGGKQASMMDATT